MLGVIANVKAVQALVPQARTATATSSAIDLAGKERAYVFISAGVMTDGTHVFKLTECDTSGGSYTDVASGDVEADGTKGYQPSFGAADDNVTAELGYVGSKRFIKVVATVSGTTTGGVYEAAVLLMGPARKRPH